MFKSDECYSNLHDCCVECECNCHKHGIELTKEECKALKKELEHNFANYENELSVSAIQRIIKFADEV